MNIKFVFAPTIAFLLILYLYFPHKLPEGFNYELEDLSKNIYISPLGPSGNERAVKLCGKYEATFYFLQLKAIGKQLERLDRLIKINEKKWQGKTGKSDKENYISEVIEASRIESLRKYEEASAYYRGLYEVTRERYMEDRSLFTEFNCDKY